MPRGRGQNRKGRSREEHFARLPVSLLDSEAYRTMPNAAKVALNYMLVGVSPNINGQIERSERWVAQRANLAASTAREAIKILQARGLIVCTSRGCMGMEGRGVGSTWRFTHIGTRAQPEPSHDYRKWVAETSTPCAAHPTTKTEPRTDYRCSLHRSPVQVNERTNRSLAPVIGASEGVRPAPIIGAIYESATGCKGADMGGGSKQVVDPGRKLPRCATKAWTIANVDCRECGAPAGDQCTFGKGNYANRKRHEGGVHRVRYDDATEALRRAKARERADV